MREGGCVAGAPQMQFVCAGLEGDHPTGSSQGSSVSQASSAHAGEACLSSTKITERVLLSALRRPAGGAHNGTKRKGCHGQGHWHSPGHVIPSRAPGGTRYH
eukprot:2014633-Rhodomonas_salina.5